MSDRDALLLALRNGNDSRISKGNTNMAIKNVDLLHRSAANVTLLNRLVLADR